MGGTNKCPLCDATFTRPQHVARHMRAHTGDRPYPCLFCPERFARSDLLSRHRNKFHPHGANSEPPPPKYTRTKPVKPRVPKLGQLKGEDEKEGKKLKSLTKKEKVALAVKERCQDCDQADRSETETPCPSHNSSDSPPFPSTSYSYSQPINTRTDLDGRPTQPYDVSSTSSTALSSSSIYCYPVQTLHHQPYDDLTESNVLSRSSLSSSSDSSNSDAGNSMLYQQQQQHLYQQQYHQQQPQQQRQQQQMLQQQRQYQQQYQQQPYPSQSRPQTTESLFFERRLSLPETGSGGYDSYQLSDTYSNNFDPSQQLSSSYEPSFLGSTYPLVPFAEPLSSSPAREAQTVSIQQPQQQHPSLSSQNFLQPQLPHQLQQQISQQQQQQRRAAQIHNPSQSTLPSQPSALTDGSPMSSTSSGSSFDTSSSRKSNVLPPTGADKSSAIYQDYSLFGALSSDYRAHNDNDGSLSQSSPSACYLPHLQQYGSSEKEIQSLTGHWAGKKETSVPLLGWKAENMTKDLQDGFVSAFPALSLEGEDPHVETNVRVPKRDFTSSPDPVLRPPQLNPLQQPAAPRRRTPTEVVSPPTAYNGGFFGSGPGHYNSSHGNSQGIKIPSLDDVKDIWKMFMQDGCGGLTPSYGTGGSFNNAQGAGGAGGGSSTGLGLTSAQHHVPIAINQTSHPLRLSSLPVISGGATVIEPPSISSSLMLPTITSTETPPLTNSFQSAPQQQQQQQRSPSSLQGQQASSDSFSTAIKSLPPLRLNFTNARKNSNRGKLASFIGLSASPGGDEGEREGSSTEISSLVDGSTGKQTTGSTMALNNTYSRMNPFGGMKREPSQELMRSGSLAAFSGIGSGSSSGSGFGFDGLDDWVDPRKKMRRMRSGSVGRIPEHEVWDGFWDSLRPSAVAAATATAPSAALPTYGFNSGDGLFSTASMRGKEDIGGVV
ncbi:urate oxidase [Phaffia rhodozyma]|uniref:Urate oxidase n=1 Tax=Phaffia rhodozyma TaxID=264483 RepID=A0A0F7SQG7_PHARH|nr:urate oxidase [Phaffia rhodozyma]